MGSSSSYLKINYKNGSKTIGVMIPYNKNYKKYTITGGNSVNCCNNTEYVTYNTYYYYGEWFFYNDDASALNRVLSNFDSKSDDVRLLMDK